MPLLNSISDFHLYVGGAVNASLDIKAIAPTVDRTMYDLLQPITGMALLEDIEASIEGTATSAHAALLPYLQRPLALLSLYHYSYIGTIQFSQNAIIRPESEKGKTPYKYEINDYRKQLKTDGYNSLERLIKYLDQNKLNYPLWTDSDEYNSQHRNLIINFSSEFNLLYSKKIDRYIFESFRSIIEEVQYWALIGLMGEAFYEEQMNKIKLNIQSGKEPQLINHLQRVVAHFTIKEAVKRNWVRFEGDRVVQLESLEPQSSHKAGTASPTSISVMIQQSDEFANRHLAKAKAWLARYQDDFPTWKTWQEELAAAEAEQAMDEDRVTYSQHYERSDQTDKAVFRF